VWRSWPRRVCALCLVRYSLWVISRQHMQQLQYPNHAFFVFLYVLRPCVISCHLIARSKYHKSDESPYHLPLSLTRPIHLTSWRIVSSVYFLLVHYGNDRSVYESGGLAVSIHFIILFWWVLKLVRLFFRSTYNHAAG
jgi:hypothetical protein